MEWNWKVLQREHNLITIFGAIRIQANSRAELSS